MQDLANELLRDGLQRRESPGGYELHLEGWEAREQPGVVPMDRALSDLARVLRSPSLRLLAETPRHPVIMAKVLKEGGAGGNLVHDAHIAALCLEQGVSELLTGDRDFHRFPGLRVVNPFR